MYAFSVLRLLLVFLVLGLIQGCSPEKPAAGSVGSAATWTGTNLIDGQTVSFPELLDGKPAVVIFWATWCSYCKAFMPYVNDIQADYENQGVQIVTLNAKERGKGDPKAYAQSLGFPMFAIADADNIAEKYNVEFIPGLMVVDGEGQVSYRRASTDLPAGKTVAQQWDGEVRNALDSLVGNAQRTTHATKGDITGLVSGLSGPEAGVWVIAETDDLGTGFIKIVVTNDDGRFLLPGLPDASYRVWVRGYGLADSTPVEAQPGVDLTLAATVATTTTQAAAVYPANYWYSLVEVPPASEFPGTGAEGNGIGKGMTSQAAFVDQMKQGCQLCHQMGNQITREIAHINDRFDSTAHAWDNRLRFGQRGARMTGIMGYMGHERTLAMFANWTDQINAGVVPQAPPRPQGAERNVVLTMWDWGHATSYVHDEVTSDKRNPQVNAYGPVYGVSMSDNQLVITDPIKHSSTSVEVPVRDPATPSYFPLSNFEPSPFWGDEAFLNAPANVHNPMMDQKGRVWMTSSIRPSGNAEWCGKMSDHPSADYFPIAFSGRQASYFDPVTGSVSLVDTCYGTHHLQFAEDDDNTLWFSGDSNAIGWLNTRQLDETGDERASQGWCPTVIDSNGDGVITKPWNEPRRRDTEADPALDTRIAGFAYGIIPNPVDGSTWIARTQPVPGQLVRLELGANPPATCKAEVFEPPFQNDAVPTDQWGFAPRGIDITRDGVIWTALSGSGHLASFDRKKCSTLNGPTATGQHCPEGWTLYPSPGPQMRNVEGPGSADFHYYAWVDQFDTLGLGTNTPIAAGSTSDALLALDPDSGEWTIMRVPYPLGFYTRGMDGRIDDPNIGWKGRGVWADYGSANNWHMEGGKGAKSKMVRFQMRPHPLAN